MQPLLAHLQRQPRNRESTAHTATSHLLWATGPHPNGGPGLPQRRVEAVLRAPEVFAEGEAAAVAGLVSPTVKASPKKSKTFGGTGTPGAILWNNRPPTVVSPPAEPYSALTALAPTTLRAYGPSGARLLAGGPGRSRLDTSR